MAAKPPLILVMSGGSGTRFWPLSRPERPKQYLDLLSKKNLLEQTWDRVIPISDSSRVFVCTTEAQARLVKTSLPECHHIILEPLPKNTAPCLMLSVAEFQKRGFDSDTPIVVLPADHTVSDEPTFRKSLEKACEFAVESQGLITFGIRPTLPHTGYGYIEAGKASNPSFFKVEKFVEKPTKAVAESFLERGNFYWNSGIFVWTLGSISKALQAFFPFEWRTIREATSSSDLKKIYANLPAVSIDHGVMEKASNVYVCPVEIGWSDVGSWNALYELKAKNPSENVVLSGTVRAVESSGCLLRLKKSKVALVGVKDLVVVEEGDTLLILDRAQDQLVRKVAEGWDGD